MGEAAAVRVRAVARGRVQGVGYRAFVLHHATELGLRGTVANRPDGSVECVIEGPGAAVDRIIELLRAGPWGARVRALDVSHEAPGPALPRMRVTA